MSGAIDFKECPRYFGGQSCRCEPKCRVCGFRKHMAIHGPFFGEEPGTKPYGHEFEPSQSSHERAP